MLLDAFQFKPVQHTNIIGRIVLVRQGIGKNTFTEEKPSYGHKEG